MNYILTEQHRDALRALLKECSNTLALLDESIRRSTYDKNTIGIYENNDALKLEGLKNRLSKEVINLYHLSDANIMAPIADAALEVRYRNLEIVYEKMFARTIKITNATEYSIAMHGLLTSLFL